MPPSPTRTWRILFVAVSILVLFYGFDVARPPFSWTKLIAPGILAAALIALAILRHISPAKGPTWFTKNYKIVVFCLAIPGIYLSAVIDGYTTMANAAVGAISTVVALAVVEGFDRQRRKRASDPNGKGFPEDLTVAR